MKKILLTSLILILTINFNAQNNNTQASLYNIGLGGFMGSIGAAINKKPNEKLSKVLLKGFWQGSLGGAFVYSSKQMVYQFDKKNQLDKLWLSKIVNSVGVSMIENASSNNNFYDKWHIHIGFNRIELETKNKLKIKYKVLPIAFLGTIASLDRGKFNLKYSLQTGTPIFITKNIKNTATYVNSIVIEEHREIQRSLAHEFIHTLQYDDFMAINVFFDKKRTKWSKKSKFIKNYTKWVHTDIPGGVILRSFYLLENINQKCYFDNYFENEANFYSNKFLCN